MATEIKEILEELKAIKVELDYIRENMPEKDMFLTSEEKNLLQESYNNEKEGKLISNKELKRQLGI